MIEPIIRPHSKCSMAAISYAMPERVRVLKQEADHGVLGDDETVFIDNSVNCETGITCATAIEISGSSLVEANHLAESMSHLQHRQRLPVALTRWVNSSLRLAIIAIFIGLPLSATAQESSGGEFTVTRATIDNGGGASEGGGFELKGTIGQADAASTPATGGAFSLRGGFWVASMRAPIEDLLFSDGFENP